jgi:hypothetical protein
MLSMTTVTYRFFRSIIINYLERKFMNDDDIGIAFIYFNHKEEPSLENLFGSLLQQLVQRRSEISEDIHSLYDIHQSKRTHPSIDEYSRLVRLEICSMSKVFIIIDALDEYHESGDNRRTLLLELQKLGSSLNILITSRPHVLDIQHSFHDFTRLEIQANDDDLKNYIEERVTRDSRLRSIIRDDLVFQDMIIQRIFSNVKGM